MGDLIVRFGPVASRAPDSLQRIGQHVRDSEGHVIQVVVLRQGRAVELSVTPGQWSGQGLLGCHLRPV